VWTHVQDGNAPTRYAIYFDTKSAPSNEAWQVSPGPWIGDADVLRRPTGESLGGWSHFTATAGDFNGDGLPDILAGTEKGNLMWFPNHGKPGEPKFLGCRVLTDEKGPLDTGWYGAPFVYDWDNDGLVDLIVGTSGNVILWWKNVGTKAEPKLSFQSFVKVGDKRLEVPEEPVAEDYGTKKTFVRDYYNQPWIGDFTGDGLPDIVTGGYTTGRIWLYKATARDEKGVPELEYVGPVEADGKPIDTTWGAGPSVGDFDGDGKLDLVTGSWWWSGIPRDPAPGEIEPIMYYKGVGRGQGGISQLARSPFPAAGSVPDLSIARPSLVDWNNDGLIDLMVSSGSSVYPYLNVGAKDKPQWKPTTQELTIPWAFTRGVDVVAESDDVNGDGQAEFLSGKTFFAIRGTPQSPQIARLGSATHAGKTIDHPGPGYGDPYYYTSVRDWDKDGKADLLYGTHQGNVYLHRSLATKDKPFEFDEGVILKTTDGKPIKVGPPVVASAKEASDFTIMQGSRIRVLSDDFDGDKIDDLIVTETFGNVWLYRNTKAGGTDTFDQPILLQKLISRSSIVCVDWNQDGKPDLLLQGTAAEPGAVMLNETKDGKPAMSKPQRPFELPYLFWGTQFSATDWNHDGDRDVMVQAEHFSFFIEQSFLTYGYREANLISASTREQAK
jgi:hypothetical protein